MTLLQTQKLFVSLLGQLIAWAEGQGYSFTLGEGYRSDGHGHMPNSLHYVKLAQDLNLFVGEDYKDQDCPEWETVGNYWLSLHPLCAWGGTFASKDYNHLSLKWQGVE